MTTTARRVAGLLIAAAAGAPLAAAILDWPRDPLRAGVTLGTALLAAGLALSAAAGGALRLAPWLKRLAIGVAAAALCGTLGTWRYLEYVADDQQRRAAVHRADVVVQPLAADRPTPDALRAAGRRLLWLSYAVGLCAAAAAVLPGARPGAPERTDVR